MPEIRRKLPTYLPLHKLLEDRKSSIKIVTGDQDTHLVSYYCKAYNLRHIVLDCNCFKEIDELIVAAYMLIFPDTNNLSKNRIIEQFYCFLKKRAEFNFLFFFLNINFILDIKSFKNQKFYTKIIDFQSINPGIHIFLFHCPSLNPYKSNQCITDLIIFNNIYLHDVKNLVLKFIFGSSSSNIKRIIYNLLNEIKLGRLLYEIEQYVPLYQFHNISLLNIKLIQLNCRTTAPIPPKFIDLEQIEKQFLKLLLNNNNKINTLKSLSGQFFNIYRQKIYILPIIQNLSHKGFIKCNKALNCNHQRTENNNHCFCDPTNLFVHDVRCRVCCFTICSGLAYHLHTVLKDFTLQQSYPL